MVMMVVVLINAQETRMNVAGAVRRITGGRLQRVVASTVAMTKHHGMVLEWT